MHSVVRLRQTRSVMWLRWIVLSILRLTFVAVLLCFVGFWVLLKFPQLLCERCRAVRFFIPFSAVYYPTAAVLGVGWLEMSAVEAAVLAVGGFLHSVPAGPVSFLISGRRRRAALAAIRYYEQAGGRACYQDTEIFGLFQEQFLVAVAMGEGRGMRAMHYAVSDDGRFVTEICRVYMPLDE